MADGTTYRGLEIIIGADSSKLRSELANVDRAASATQKNLSRISRALRLDPESGAGLAAQLTAVRERAQTASRRLATLAQAARQVRPDSIERLSSHTYNAAQAAQAAHDKYNKLDVELAKIKGSLRETLDAAGVSYDASDTAEKLAERARGLRSDIDQVTASIGRLTEQRRKALADMGTADYDKQVRSLRVEYEAAAIEARDLAAQQERLRSQLAVADSAGSRYKALADEVKSSGEAFKVLSERVSAAREATESLGGFSSKLSAYKAYARELGDAMTVTTQRISAMARQMDELRSAGANPTGDTVTELRKATDAAVTARARLNEVSQSLNEARDRLAALQAQASNTVGKTDEEVARANDALRRQEETVRSLASEVQQLGTAAREAGSAMDEAARNDMLRSLSTQVVQARGQLASLKQSWSSVASDLNEGFRSMGYSIMTSWTPAFTMIGSYVARSADEIDAAFRDMKKTTEGTDEQFQKLLDDAIEMSRTKAVSADDILEIEALGGQMGIAADSVEDFAHTVSNLDIATNIDADDAATELGQFANITHMTTDEYSKFGDALVRLGNNLPTQESNIMNISSRIGSMATMVGFTKDQILGWSAALASTGMNQEAAGTALQTTIGNIEASVASGDEKLQKFAEVAGMSAAQFSAAWRSDPSQALAAFVSGLQRINDSGGSASTTLGELDINYQRQRTALLGLAQETKVTSDGQSTLTKSLQMSRDAFNGVTDAYGEAGDAAREADQKSEGFSGQLKILANNAQAMGAEVANAMVPLLVKATDAVKGITEIVGGTSDEFKRFVVVAGTVVAALGPALVAVTGLTRGFGSLFNMLSKTGLSFSMMLSNISPVKVALLGVAAAIGVVVAKVAEHKAKQEEAAQAAERDAKAQRSLADAFNEVRSSQEESASASDRQAQSTQRLADANESLRSRIEEAKQGYNELFDSSVQSYESVVNSNGAMDEYRATIDELGGSVVTNADDQQRLTTALNAVNSACGTTFATVESGNGIILQNTDAVDAAIESYQKLAEAQALGDILTDQYKQLEELKTLADDANDALGSAEDERAKAFSSFVQELSGYGGVAKDAIDALTTSGVAMDTIYRAASGDKEAIAQITTQMSEAGVSAENLTRYVDSLNGALLYNEYDGKTLGEYTKDVNDAKNNVSDLAAQIDKVQGNIDSTNDRMTQLGDATKQASTGTHELAQSFADATSASEDADDAISSVFDKVTESADDTSDAADTIDAALTQIRENAEVGTDEAESNITSAVQSMRGALESLGLDVSKVSDGDLMRLAANSGVTGEKILEAAQNVSEAKKAYESWAKSIEQLKEDISGFNEESGYFAQRIYELFGDSQSIVTWSSALSNAGLSIDDAKKSYESLADVSNPLDKWEEQTDVSAEQILGNLGTSIDQISQWSDLIDDFYRSAQESGDATQVRAVQWLESLGPTYLPLVRQFAIDANGEFEELARLLDVQEQANANSTIDNMSAEYDAILAVLDANGDGMVTKAELVGAGMGEAQIDSWIASLDANGDGVIDAADAQAREAADAAKQAATEGGQEAGQAQADGFVAGMDDGQPPANQAGADLADAAAQGASGSTDQSAQAGQDQANGFIAGMDDGQPPATQAGAELAQAGAQGVSDNADAYGQAGTEAGDKLTGSMDDLTSQMEERGRLAGENFLYGFGNVDVTSDAASFASSITDAINSQSVDAGSLSSYADSVVSSVQSAIDSAAQGGIDVSGLQSAIDSALSGASGAASAAAADAGSASSGIGAGVASGVIASIQSGLDSIQSSQLDASGITAAIAGSLDGADKGEEMASGVVSALSASLATTDTSSLGAAGGNLAKDVADGMGSAQLDLSAFSAAIASGLGSEADATGAQVAGQNLATSWEVGFNAQGVAGALLASEAINATVASTLSSAQAGAGTVGEVVGNSYAAGLNGVGVPYAADASGNINAAVASALSSAVGPAGTVGGATGSAYAGGIGSQSGAAWTSANGLKAMALNALSGGTGEAYTYGAHLGQNFASGLGNQAGAIAAAASSAMSAAKSVMGFSVPKAGPWSGAERGGVTSGRHLAQNIAVGLVEGYADVRAASRMLMDGAKDVWDATDGVVRGTARTAGTGGVTIVFNDATLNDDNAIRSGALALFSDVMRKVGM